MRSAATLRGSLVEVTLARGALCAREQHLERRRLDGLGRVEGAAHASREETVDNPVSVHFLMVSAGGGWRDAEAGLEQRAERWHAGRGCAC